MILLAVCLSFAPLLFRVCILFTEFSALLIYQ